MIIALILLISFVATLVRSTMGFGESLIAVPLFLFFLPADVAVPLSVMLSVFVALVIIIQDHSKIDFKSAGWLIFYAALGIPLGLLVLKYGNEKWIKIGLGTLIIIYSLYSLFGKLKIDISKNNQVWLFGCGFLSGIMGGAYGLNGPPLVIYGNLKKWPADHFRATLQAYFLLASFLGLIGYYSQGMVTLQLGSYFLYALITAVPAIFLGRILNKKINNPSFFNYAYYGLIIIGIVLILNSIK